MPMVEPGLTVKSLAEVAWLVSRLGPQMIASQAEPSSTALRDFWQSTRKLQQIWDQFLDQEPFSVPDAATHLEQIAAQVFTTELLTRVWATILGSIDQRTGRNDLTRIATNSVSGLLQIRHRLLKHILHPSAPSGSWAADLDRLRRRCDRWTDLLIGNLCGADEFFRFAFDAERARDFAEDAHDGVNASHPVELLVAAGVRLSFLGQLPTVSVDSPAFQGLMQSILGSLPEQAFYRDGSLREQLLPVSTARIEPSDAADDVLLPGISLTSLRRRFP
ncbi:MAG: hypothetical protein JSS49_20325 [Planctomycetes bacterium]|nr:hypothetical protein [Planctomycetota bacterium]